MVVLGGQEITGAAEAATVKLLVAEACPHAPLAVKVTPIVPPHDGGAPELLLEIVIMQSPVADTSANQSVNAASTSACVKHPVIVLFAGAVIVTIPAGGGGGGGALPVAKRLYL